jgi:hypothetical protein
MEPENKIENEIENKPKKKFNFKEYYNSNEEFKKRHLEKLREKVFCPCGHLVARVNLSKHKRTKVHLTQLEYKNKLQN